MARKYEAEQLLRQGFCPSEIAGQMGISVKSVIQYLCTQVGEGSLRLSDLYFSWTPEKRAILKRAGQESYVDDRTLSSNGLCREDLKLFESLRSRGVFKGDMYEYISEAEIALHQLVRATLQRVLGVEETGWWRDGIPSNIRVKCATRREEDDQPCEAAYAYTTLIELSVVISKNWAMFQPILPKEYAGDKRPLERDLIRLNGIRNAVMHPVKERTWTESDFEFVRRFSGLFKAIEVV